LQNDFESKDLLKIGTTSGFYEKGDRWNQFSDSQDDLVFDGNGLLIPGLNTSGKEPLCSICCLSGSQIKKTYYLGTDFVIIECLICGLPVAILREHTMSVPIYTLNKIQRKALEMFGAVRIEVTASTNHVQCHIIKNDEDLLIMRNKH
jgi:hypothetical protein